MTINMTLDFSKIKQLFYHHRHIFLVVVGSASDGHDIWVTGLAKQLVYDLIYTCFGRDFIDKISPPFKQNIFHKK